MDKGLVSDPITIKNYFAQEEILHESQIDSYQYLLKLVEEAQFYAAHGYVAMSIDYRNDVRLCVRVSSAPVESDQQTVYHHNLRHLLGPPD